MSIASDVQALVSANPTAAAVVDILEIAIAVYFDLTKPDLPSELATADKAADALEMEKFAAVAADNDNAAKRSGPVLIALQSDSTKPMTHEQTLVAIQSTIAASRALMAGQTVPLPSGDGSGDTTTPTTKAGG